MARIISRYRVREVLGEPNIGDGELTDIVDGANRDADEGPEWLPYYKAALGLLAMGMGSLSALCSKLIDELSRRPDVNPEAVANLRRVLGNARTDWDRHLRLVGIGPSTDPAAIAKCEELIRQDRLLTGERFIPPRM
jgi:hypothetical protein